VASIRRTAAPIASFSFSPYLAIMSRSAAFTSSGPTLNRPQEVMRPSSRSNRRVG
jgi:hypothetical protein